MSINKVVNEQHEKMKKGLDHIAVSASADGKHFIAEHHMNDYNHPKHMDTHVLKSKAEMGKHLAKHLGCCGGAAGNMGGMEDDEDDEEE